MPAKSVGTPSPFPLCYFPLLLSSNVVESCHCRVFECFLFSNIVFRGGEASCIAIVMVTAVKQSKCIFDQFHDVFQGLLAGIVDLFHHFPFDIINASCHSGSSLSHLFSIFKENFRVFHSLWSPEKDLLF